MTGSDYFDDNSGFVWSQSIGMGYYPVENPVYDKAYFDKYVDMSKTEMGEKLNNARFNIVNKYADGLPLVDVGVGSGAFMASIGCVGFDVNPFAIEWLKYGGLWFDPYKERIDCATMWDSLEHIFDPTVLLKNVRKYLFVSIPVFDDMWHVLRSKHFRTDEHYWYFTKDGFARFIAHHGFSVVYYSEIETELGRDGIGTFVCKRVG